jgi:hypothetical protein
MNLNYWEEHIKASVAIAAHLLVPIDTNIKKSYLPIIVLSH